MHIWLIKGCEGIKNLQWKRTISLIHNFGKTGQTHAKECVLNETFPLYILIILFETL